jgi:hypothetical protein
MPETKNERLRQRCLSALAGLEGLEAVCVVVSVNIYLRDQETARLARERLSGVDFEEESVEYHINPPLSCEAVMAFWKIWGGYTRPDPNLAERMHAHLCNSCDACWDALVPSQIDGLSLAVGSSQVVTLTWNSLGKKYI